MSPESRRVGQAIAALLGAVAVVFLLANAHLIYVAMDQQPECVHHAKEPGAGGFRAAGPAC